jgi:hypothetical protein
VDIPKAAWTALIPTFAATLNIMAPGEHHSNKNPRTALPFFTDKFASGGEYETEYHAEVQDIEDTLMNAVTNAETAITVVTPIKDEFLALLNVITAKFETID